MGYGFHNDACALTVKYFGIDSASNWPLRALRL